MMWWEILLIILITSFTVFMIIYASVRKIKGKPIGGSCGGSCAACTKKCSMNGQTLLDEYHKCKCNCQK